MNAIEILIADSLAESLSSATFDGTVQKVNAVRTYVADYTLDDLSDLRVSVVPGSVEVSNHTHGADLFEYEVHVVLGKKLLADEEIDDMIDLRTNIVDSIRSKTLPASTPAMPAGVQWFGITNVVTYDRDQVTGSRVFLADISVSYRRANAKVS
jgi:hypothetical protein